MYNITAIEKARILSDPSCVVDLYNQHRNSFVNDYELRSYVTSESALQAIWCTYVAHNLKDYGNGPNTLAINELLSAEDVMCSQYTTITLHLMNFFGRTDGLLKPIGWTKSFIGDHSQILFKNNTDSFLIDPTTGILIPKVSLQGLLNDTKYFDLISFKKNDELDYYIDDIHQFFSSARFGINDIAYVVNSFTDWEQRSWWYDVPAADYTLSGVRYVIGKDSVLKNNIDILFGSNTTDLLFGRKGNDKLHNNLSGDKLFGGPGNDIYYIDNYYTMVSESLDQFTSSDAGGVDKIVSSVSVRAPNFVENITLVGNNKINATGNGLNNKIYGNSNENIIRANFGKDIVYGGGGADKIYLGNDRVRDIVGYKSLEDSTYTNFDVIYNFKSGIDKVDISSFTDYVQTQYGAELSFSNSSHQQFKVWGADVGNNYFIHADLNGDTNPDVTAMFIAVNYISSNDLIL